MLGLPETTLAACFFDPSTLFVVLLLTSGPAGCIAGAQLVCRLKLSVKPGGSLRVMCVYFVGCGLSALQFGWCVGLISDGQK